MNDLVLKLLERSETVWTMTEIAQLFPSVGRERLYDQLRYFVRVGKIQRLKRGVYARKKYEPLELANKLYSPSYISLETVLAMEGVVFQYYERIFVASYLTREIGVDGQTFQYRRLKKQVLVNPAGIEKGEGYYIAEKERAWLDAVYIYGDYHFDHLDGLDWDKVMQWQGIYENKALIRRVEEYYKTYLEEK